MLIADISNSLAMQALPLALDAASQRQQLFAANIANANNPDWRAQKLTFEESMQTALAAHDGHGPLQVVQTRVMEDSGESGLNAQIVHMSRNVLHYQALVKATNAQLELISMASNDGRR
jgi:flagellar basal body rod protein FlgB